MTVIATLLSATAVLFFFILVVDTVTPYGEVQQVDKQGRFFHCFQSSAVGPCRARFLKWYYNAGTGKCDVFYYGGCLGSDNMFNTKYECQMNCEIPLALR